MAIADRHGLAVIEDCAESHGATVRGRQTGSFGTMSCFSFYANKIVTTGEGGMVLTTTTTSPNGCGCCATSPSRSPASSTSSPATTSA